MVLNNFLLMAKKYGFQHGGFDFIPEELPSNSSVTVNGFTFETLFTPGHSPDHISFYFKEHDFLIAGDALFRESIGRTDLYIGDLHTLLTSIRTRLYSLPHQNVFYPGQDQKSAVKVSC